MKTMKADTSALTWTNVNQNRVILGITVLILLDHFNVNQSSVNPISQHAVQFVKMIKIKIVFVQKDIEKMVFYVTNKIHV